MRRGTHPALHLHQPLEQGMLVPGHPNLRRLGSKHLPPAISIQDIQGIKGIKGSSRGRERASILRWSEV